MLDGATYSPKWKGNAEKYLEGKLKILTDHFCITPTEREMTHLKTLKTPTEIDNAILTIINNRWN